MATTPGQYDSFNHHTREDVHDAVRLPPLHSFVVMWGYPGAGGGTPHPPSLSCRSVALHHHRAQSVLHIHNVNGEIWLLAQRAISVTILRSVSVRTGWVHPYGDVISFVFL